MADNRKYYYLKLKENFFDSDSIVLLEDMKDGILYSNILLKLYLKSLKNGGKLQLDEHIPYTAQMIATLTRHQIGTVERALEIFRQLGLVEQLDSGAFYMTDIELMIGQSSTEAERKRAARLENKALLPSRTKGGHLSDIRPPEIEIELEKEIKIEKEREGETGHPALAAYGRYNNVILTDNHIIYNSTALDSIRKFRDFLLSGLAVQRLSDLICLEHQLSVIEIKPYRERQKRTLYPPKESNRDRLCGVIDTVLAEKPKDYEDFLQGLEQQGYEVKRGKYTSVKGARQKRFIRFRTLGAGYSEEELKAVISGEAEHHPRQKQKRIVPEQKFQMLVDIQAKLAEGKSMGYARWAKRYNLKEMSKTLIFLQEHKIGSIKEMQERVDAATARYHELGDSIKAAEARMTEIAVLRTHIVNYARTRPVYDAYRKAGYSKRFLEAHREEITLHKAAKAAFDEAGLKKLPKTKDLSIEYAELLKKKKEAYPDYRKAQDEMQELMKAQKNVEMFFAEEKDTAEKEPTR